MSLKDILVLLDGGTASDGRLRLATNIARDQHACLSAAFLQHSRAPGYLFGLDVPRLELVSGLPALSAPDIPRSAALAEIAEQRFRDSLRSFRVKGDWYPLAHVDTDELIALARAADLIIIGQINPDARPPVPAWKPEELVVSCGRPVLMIPYIGNYTEVGRRVLIAWDGSQEAARAINDALPVISTAEVVTVMTVRARVKDLERHHQSLERIVRHLTRHGIAVRTDQTLRGSNSIAEVLLSKASDLAVDLIVAGAYHHSPLREALIGGVSREIFQHMTVPVLMSH
jgi:nucleotide-binding universal stress UspA family protein